jgi:hypothetical protein
LRYRADVRTRQDLEQRLGEHIKWLRSSAQAFDAGDASEAKRIATAMRTLVHDTGVSRGLLVQAGMRDRIPWLSAVELEPDGFAGPPWLETVDMPGYRHIPGIPEFECTFQEWWKGRLLEYKATPIDRAWFVLRTTNFDGGAHVDPVLPADYRAITRDGGLEPKRINSAGNAYPDLSNPVPSAPHLKFAG